MNAITNQSDRPMHFCYADPPYPGQAHKYKGHPNYAGEVDHKALIERLMAEYPDGWALSTSSKTLWEILHLCPSDIRVLAWCCGDARRPPFRGLTSAWQPLIIRRGRVPSTSCLDFLVGTRVPDGPQSGFDGFKPEMYCFWLFRCLGARPGDVLDDLFPGSGAVGRAWEKYIRQISYLSDGEAKCASSQSTFLISKG